MTTVRHWPWMYLNPQGQVCVGDDHVIDSPTAAKALPWMQAFTMNAGALATPEQIEAEWRRVKACQAACALGGGCFRALTTLRLTDADLTRG